MIVNKNILNQNAKFLFLEVLRLKSNNSMPSLCAGNLGTILSKITRMVGCEFDEHQNTFDLYKNFTPIGCVST